MRVVALVGLKYAGKSTVAVHMTSSGQAAHELAFAAPLKAGLAATLNIDVTALHDPSRKETLETTGVAGEHHTYRTLMTTFGDAIRSCFGQDIFVNVMRNRLLELEAELPKHAVVVISDARMCNEVTMLRDEFNAIVMRVVRQDIGAAVVQNSSEQWTRDSADDQNQHSTETEQLRIEADVTIVNGGSKKQLFKILPIALTTARKTMIKRREQQRRIKKQRRQR